MKGLQLRLISIPKVHMQLFSLVILQKEIRLKCMDCFYMKLFMSGKRLKSSWVNENRALSLKLIQFRRSLRISLRCMRKARLKVMGWKGKKPTSFSLDVSKAAEAHVKNIVMDTVQSLVNLSPVDTGAYRASHIVSIGSADFGVREPETNPIQDAAIQAVKIKLGNLVYIQNNKAYAPRLENGWSDQAPQGIYGLTFNFISQKYGG
ncbi:hypothetical protein AB237_1070 [Acinetobacter baumannii NCGM 237]|nr:hypothetical protein AB237_1070 [Acinetobacter baumannii NCGM 237]